MQAIANLVIMTEQADVLLSPENEVIQLPLDDSPSYSPVSAKIELFFLQHFKFFKPWFRIALVESYIENNNIYLVYSCIIEKRVSSTLGSWRSVRDLLYGDVKVPESHLNSIREAGRGIWR